MRRPLKNKRPFGPLFSSSTKSTNVYRRVEVEQNHDNLDAEYKITGYISTLVKEKVGKVVYANEIVINEDYRIDPPDLESVSGSETLEIEATYGKGVQVVDANSEVVKLVL